MEQKTTENNDEFDTKYGELYQQTREKIEKNFDIYKNQINELSEQEIKIIDEKLVKIYEENENLRRELDITKIPKLEKEIEEKRQKLELKKKLLKKIERSPQLRVNQSNGDKSDQNLKKPQKDHIILLDYDKPFRYFINLRHNFIVQYPKLKRIADSIVVKILSDPKKIIIEKDKTTEDLQNSSKDQLSDSQKLEESNKKEYWTAQVKVLAIYNFEKHAIINFQ
ncbi:hypothetical protein M0811_13040 [Anaeramoeba ignava]|uniref:Uncharacterized protein n=1 Tax=Anaeramoeba ignava TaxID=1746090 RepID=A0A9Q0L9S7_ANAIG|nr:hypothetical protein M0811_13040 [Anaeramoeba ignava]